MEHNIFYPMLFEPYYKPVMWGGGNLAKVLNGENIGTLVCKE